MRKEYSPNLRDSLAMIRRKPCYTSSSISSSRQISTQNTRRVNGFQSYWLRENLFFLRTHGTFIESGAADIHSSVTDYFEREFCWYGIGIEPIIEWAISNGRERLNMLSVNGALCEESMLGERRDFVVDGDLGELSGFNINDENNDSNDKNTAVTCNDPTSLITSTGMTHVDLFVLDCEGCELSVLRTLENRQNQQVSELALPR